MATAAATLSSWSWCIANRLDRSCNPPQQHLLELPVNFPQHNHGQTTDMIELNPVRQRIADLKGRLDALRGYL